MRSADGGRLGTRHRILAATGGAAAVAFAAAACSGVSTAPSTASSALSSESAASADGAGFAQSCTTMPLKPQLAAAVRGGASLIVASGTPAGKSVTGNPATAGAPAFYAMTLRSVRTLRGPAVASGETAWSPGPAPAHERTR